MAALKVEHEQQLQRAMVHFEQRFEELLDGRGHVRPGSPPRETHDDGGGEARSVAGRVSALLSELDTTIGAESEEPRDIREHSGDGGGGGGLEARLREVFDRVDKDSDGAINRRELIIALRKHQDICDLLNLPGRIRQEDGSRDRVEAFFQTLDADADNSLTLEELLRHFTPSGGGGGVGVGVGGGSDGLDGSGLALSCSDVDHSAMEPSPPPSQAWSQSETGMPDDGVLSLGGGVTIGRTESDSGAEDALMRSRRVRKDFESSGGGSSRHGSSMLSTQPSAAETSTGGAPDERLSRAYQSQGLSASAASRADSSRVSEEPTYDFAAMRSVRSSTPHEADGRDVDRTVSSRVSALLLELDSTLGADEGRVQEPAVLPDGHATRPESARTAQAPAVRAAQAEPIFYEDRLPGPHQVQLGPNEQQQQQQSQPIQPSPSEMPAAAVLAARREALGESRAAVAAAEAAAHDAEERIAAAGAEAAAREEEAAAAMAALEGEHTGLQREHDLLLVQRARQVSHSTGLALTLQCSIAPLLQCNIAVATVSGCFCRWSRPQGSRRRRWRRHGGRRWKSGRRRWPRRRRWRSRWRSRRRVRL